MFATKTKHAKPMKRFRFLFCLFVTLLALNANAQDDKLKQEILKLEHARYDMMVKRDVAGLQDIVTDDLTYVHSGGNLENKEQFLAGIAKSTFAAIVPKDEIVRVYGKTAIVTGTAEYKMQAGTVTNLRYTNVYVKQGKQWKLAARHTAKLP